MARACYKVRVGKEEFKLRLTLAGQKNLMEKNPEVPILAIIMSAADDPVDMEALLTEALNWDGNENSVTDGAELYDLMVDNGYRGAKKFAEIALGIAHNAGLLDDDERKKVARVVNSQINKAFDGLMADEEQFAEWPDHEEGVEGSENPPLRTLDA